MTQAMWIMLGHWPPSFLFITWLTTDFQMTSVDKILITNGTDSKVWILVMLIKILNTCITHQDWLKEWHFLLDKRNPTGLDGSYSSLLLDSFGLIACGLKPKSADIQLTSLKCLKCEKFLNSPYDWFISRILFYFLNCLFFYYSIFLFLF